MGHIYSFQHDNLSEWLRRQTRNLLGFARASSNPAVVAFFVVFTISFGVHCGMKVMSFVSIPFLYTLYEH